MRLLAHICLAAADLAGGAALYSGIGSALEALGVPVPHNHAELGKMLGGFLVLVVGEIWRAYRARKIARVEAHKAIDSRTPATDEKTPPGAPGAITGGPGDFVPGVDPSTIPIAEDVHL